MGNDYSRVVEAVAAGIPFAVPLVLVGLAAGASRIFCSPRRDLSIRGTLAAIELNLTIFDPETSELAN